MSRKPDLRLDQSENEDREAWIRISLPALERVWSNEADAVYDNWRKLYRVSEPNQADGS